MITLFKDQEELIAEARHALTKSRNLLIVAATGAGKTVLTASMIQTAISKGKRAMMVVPRRDLLVQTSNTFSEFGIEHSFVSAGYGYNPFSKCYIATTPTLVNRLDQSPDVDLVFFDESHFGKTALEKSIMHYKRKNAFIVGLSATPIRLDSRGLGCWYDNLVCGKSVAWLIAEKRLSEFRMFAPSHPDLSSIGTVAGDYNKHQLSDLMEQDRVLIGRAVDHYKTHAMGRINITYCVSRKHAEITNQSFLDAAIPSAYVDGETSDADRKKIFRALACREILNVTSVDLVTLGFDLSSSAGMPVTIESISILRPTKSLALYSQIVGRALRYKPFPALIFDHANCCRTHGLPDAEREWTLADQSKSGRDNAEKTVAVRQCPKCDMCFSPAPICPSCNFIFPIQSREIDEIDGELHEITEVQLKMDKKKRRAACKTIEELIKFAEAEGYSNPMAWAAKWHTTREYYKREKQ